MGQRIKPWNKVPDLIDRSIMLTDHEFAVLSDSVKQVTRNIFRREDDPIRIRILLACIKDVAEAEALAQATRKEATFKRKVLEKKARKEKKSC